MSTGRTIKIANPPLGHAGYVGPVHADRWIRQGKAFWQLNGQLRLSDTLRRSVARLGPLVQGQEYDAIRRIMTQNEKRHIPLAQPPQRVTRRKMVVGQRVLKTTILKAIALDDPNA